MLMVTLMRGAHKAQPWIERLARLGYGTQGVVYLIIGSLAVAAGRHRGGSAGDQHTAIEVIAGWPFGRGLLLIAALGLTGYAVWSVLSAITDSDHRGRDIKGMALRAGSVARGLAYGSFAIAFLRLALLHRHASGGSDDSSRHWTGRALDEPFGRTIVAAVGLTIVGYGVVQFSRAVRGKLSRQIDLSSMTPSTRRLLTAVGSFGIGARAVVFVVIGVSLCRAALRRSAGVARGTSGALRQMAALPHGSWILVILGFGVAAYGGYAFINARYRTIRTT